jgi:hypothetical protein
VRFEASYVTFEGKESLNSYIRFWVSDRSGLQGETELFLASMGKQFSYVTFDPFKSYIRFSKAFCREAAIGQRHSKEGGKRLGSIA